jgi:hypothetical protein
MQIFSPAAFHICLCAGKRSMHSLVYPFYKALFTKDERRIHMFRFVLHHGTDKELLGELQEFGIDKESLDTSIGGTGTRTACPPCKQQEKSSQQLTFFKSHFMTLVCKA